MLQFGCVRHIFIAIVVCVVLVWILNAICCTEPSFSVSNMHYNSCQNLLYTTAPLHFSLRLVSIFSWLIFPLFLRRRHTLIYTSISLSIFINIRIINQNCIFIFLFNVPERNSRCMFVIGSKFSAQVPKEVESSVFFHQEGSNRWSWLHLQCIQLLVFYGLSGYYRCFLAKRSMLTKMYYLNYINVIIRKNSQFSLWIVRESCPTMYSIPNYPLAYTSMDFYQKMKLLIDTVIYIWATVTTILLWWIGVKAPTL